MAIRESKNISFTPKQAQFIDERVESGQYQSASEVVRAGLRLLEDDEINRQERLLRIRQLIETGLEDVQQGRVVDGEDVFKRLREKHQKLAEATDETV